ncbi:MAG TPA: radical SAM protein, partial [Chitinophagaceae bacterium]|nr:radical SAM protein [Chitinophagaceae bacterium]
MKQTSILLVTPPFTQLNTPYPATAYLKGFLNTQQISNFQIDLGLEVTLELLSVDGLNELFDSIESKQLHSENAHRIFNQKDRYIEIISSVIRFLQGKDPTLAYLFSQPGFLPQAARFDVNEFPEELFGQMGIQDKAKHLCTMFLEDLSDFIQENKDPHFGFSRYAEQLARSANTFDEIALQLKAALSWVDGHTITCLRRYI